MVLSVNHLNASAPFLTDILHRSRDLSLSDAPCFIPGHFSSTVVLSLEHQVNLFQRKACGLNVEIPYERNP